MYVVLEGSRDGLPVYCTPAPRLRIHGRAIPDRLVVTPEQAGLAGEEIHWTELRPDRQARGWTRSRLPMGDGRWVISLDDLGTEDETGRSSRFGTRRFAAAIDVSIPGGPRRVLPTSGFERGSDTDPERAPGYRVTRSGGDNLADHALGLAQLPVLESATDAQVRERVALRPVDLVLATYEELADGPLPGDRAAAITGPEWEWLFETVRPSVWRRTAGDLPAVAPDARPVAWGFLARAGADVRRDDVLVTDTGQIALLSADDGDGWLGEGDSVIDTVTGEVAFGRLHELTGRALTVLRVRDFRELRRKLAEAGYGNLGVSPYYGADLRRACRELQGDQGLAVTGIPDPATLAALDEFLAALRAHDTTGSPGDR